MRTIKKESLVHWTLTSIVGIGAMATLQPCDAVAQGKAKESGPATSATPSARAKSDEDDARIGAPQISGMVILSRPEDVVAEGVTGVIGVQSKSLKQFDTLAFKARMEPFFQKKDWVTKDLDRLALAIKEYGRTKTDLFAFDVAIPEQRLVGPGYTLQILVLPARVKKISVVNEGRHWISDRSVISRSGLTTNAILTQATMNRALSTFEVDPFVRVEPKVTNGDKLGTTDVEFVVHDRFPVMFGAGYQNYGSQVIGEHQLVGTADIGNVFGAGHRLVYQYLTDVDFKYLRSHSASYIAPLPWNHRLVVYGGYADISPDLSKIPGLGTGASLDGKAYSVGFQYSVPLAKTQNSRHEAFVGLDYKFANTTADLPSSGISVNNPYDSLVWNVGYRGQSRDRLGRNDWEFKFLNTPGGLVSHDNKTDYAPVRGADSSFSAISGSLERRLNLTFLPHHAKPTREEDFFGLNLKATGSWSPDRLPPSEMVRLGGHDTVRGYEESLVSGDRGFNIRTELWTPWIYTHWKGQHTPLVGAFAFYDYGKVAIRDFVSGTDGFARNYNLSAVGGGLRLRLASNLKAAFDYGFVVGDNASGIVDSLPSKILGAGHGSKAHVSLQLTY